MNVYCRFACPVGFAILPAAESNSLYNDYTCWFSSAKAISSDVALSVLLTEKSPAHMDDWSPYVHPLCTNPSLDASGPMEALHLPSLGSLSSASGSPTQDSASDDWFPLVMLSSFTPPHNLQGGKELMNRYL